MNRRQIIGFGTAALSTLSLSPLRLSASPAKPMPLTPPKGGKIIVGVVVGNPCAVIDFAGPWEVFQDTALDRATQTAPSFFNSSWPVQQAKLVRPFELYMVSDTVKPITAGENMTIVPHNTFANAPAPNVVVVGAQAGHSAAKFNWIRENASRADVTMSVCTGAYVLGATGVLDGLFATTHHAYYDDFAKTYPKVHLVRGPRYVENERISSSGGLASGIELALRVVERYYGVRVATDTASWMEYSRSNKRPS